MRVGQGLMAALSSVVLSGVVGSCALAGSPADAIPHFNVKACTNLGNSLEAPEEGDWPNNGLRNGRKDDFPEKSTYRRNCSHIKTCKLVGAHERRQTEYNR